MAQLPAAANRGCGSGGRRGGGGKAAAALDEGGGSGGSREENGSQQGEERERGKEKLGFVDYIWRSPPVDVVVYL